MRLLLKIRQYGIIGCIRKGLQSFLGFNKQQETIDTLYYLLNNFVLETSELSPTKDANLRVMQQCDAVLLSILDKIFKKYNLVYWLDFGTLLGAYRHKGFIPWDDDTDISMPRNDYNKVIDILKKELSENDFDIEAKYGRIGIGYKHLQTGIWCDIFPVDSYKAIGDFNWSVLRLKDKINSYQRFYAKHEYLSYDVMQQHRRRIICDENGETFEIVYHGREYNHLHPRAFYCTKDIYPISKVQFEGLLLSAPSNVPLYLEKIYGKDYMQLPKGGLLHHAEGRGNLSTWASKSGVDMCEILSELMKIKESI